MIDRYLKPKLREMLQQFPAVALLGPRQVGKTTLAREMAPKADYLDLENPEDRQKLEDARGFLMQRTGRLIILDEVQRMPGLFQVLRGVIDERIRAGEEANQFLLLGSASIDLLKQSSETLAGRIAYLELGPFNQLELPEQTLEQHWLRGGFPRSVLAASDEQSLLWRDNFVSTYLERDIPLLGPRIPAETLRRFWTMLAHSQGSLLNASQLAKSLAVDGKTVAKYLDLMVDLLMVRRLQPYHVNVSKRLVKSPKTYVRDSGLLHSLLRLDSLNDLLGHPIAGPSWEGYVVENILAVVPQRTEAFFYRTATGVELDLLLELPGRKRWAIEIKRGLAPKLEKGVHVALEDIQPDKAFVVYAGADRYPRGEGIEVIALPLLLQELASL